MAWKSGCDIFLCTSFGLQNTYGQEIELILLACQRSQCWLVFSSPSWGLSPRQEPAVYADENDARFDLIYMNTWCSWNAYACMQLVGGPSASFISLLLRVCAWLCRVTCNWGKACTKGWLPGRVRQPRLMGRTYGDAQYSMSFAIECHLRSPVGLRQVWWLVLPGKALPTLASTCERIDIVD